MYIDNLVMDYTLSRTQTSLSERITAFAKQFCRDELPKQYSKQRIKLFFFPFPILASIVKLGKIKIKLIQISNWPKSICDSYTNTPQTNRLHHPNIAQLSAKSFVIVEIKNDLFPESIQYVQGKVN